ncbi:MAG: hypothetical protein WC539_05300 [Nitrospirota bacterium]
MKLIPAFIISLCLMIGAAVPAFSAEELFDTEASSKHISEGRALLHQKKFDAAIQQFEAASEINPNAESFFYAGYAYYLKGRNGNEESLKKSRENFDKAYELDPGFSPLRTPAAEPMQGRENAPASQKPPQTIAPGK